MAQFGMKLPGGSGARAAGMDVYTALGFLAVVALLIATVAMYFAASRVGPDGNAFGIQEPGKIKLAGVSKGGK
ncbi:MAG: hypothetical protein SFY96_04130 [Planctomycetota bacterium]|nr:hypothetical protein [Planctomycetota bacterium]